MLRKVIAAREAKNELDKSGGNIPQPTNESEITNSFQNEQKVEQIPAQENKKIVGAIFRKN